MDREDKKGAKEGIVGGDVGGVCKGPLGRRHLPYSNDALFPAVAITRGAVCAACDDNKCMGRHRHTRRSQRDV